MVHAVDVDDRVLASLKSRLASLYGCMTRMVRSTPSMTSKVAFCDQMLVGADDADDRARLATAQMDLVAQLFNATDDGFDVLRLRRGIS